MRTVHKCLIAVALLGAVAVLLALVVVSGFERRVHPPERAASLFVASTAKVAFATFRFACGRYPTTDEGFLALVVCPESMREVWTGPYLDLSRPEVPKDPWGRPYQYCSPGIKNLSTYDVWSLGPDGIVSADDIGNW
ncbi:type II secretion system protein GspG [Congregicoccus parvus]|uniref:type II secretion system protein GspG n=1 Tax=Congregicoccus parvus TaxID=3081749 RepID=UPI003FA549C0